jgi:cellulose synthase/poly-beta-1,6-N-acetylglucosamine synthase-like glycosyltransferase
MGRILAVKAFNYELRLITEMIILDLLIIAWMAAGCIYWLVVLWLTVRIVRMTPLLEKLPDPRREEWPRVSVIVPLRDEAEHVKGPVSGRLAEDYPGMELILVDDRSTDGTAELVDSLAASDARVRAVHVEELPGGWIGKAHALQRGVEESGWEWLAFSDADTDVKPGTLRKAVAYCEGEGLDHLAVIPGLYRGKSLVDSVSQVLLRVMLITERVWKAGDVKSGAAVGSPSLALVRRAALEKESGLADLRMEPSEDVALAQMIKASGGRSGVVNGRGLVGASFPPKMRDMAQDMEMGIYASLGGFNLARIFWLTLLFFALEFGPYLFFFPFGIPYHDLIGTFAVSIGIVVSIIICRWMGLPLMAAFYFPIDLFIVVFILLRAGIVGTAQGGLWWKGDFYPTEMLAMGRRFRYR